MQVEKILKFNQAFNQESDSNLAIDQLDLLFKKNMYDIHDLLFSYHYTKRERVYDIILNKEDFIYSNGRGSFLAKYMIGFFNGCADLDFNNTEKMKITFSVDFKNDTVLLIGEYIPDEEQHEI
ncbi:hypothetical protein [Pseudopedobacter saltans]|nr:hypothetical protein [Pseudopedobacter saltans]